MLSYNHEKSAGTLQHHLRPAGRPGRCGKFTITTLHGICWDIFSIQAPRSPLTATPQSEVFLAWPKQSRNPVGIIKIYAEPHGNFLFPGSNAGQERGHIESLYVRPDHRGRGIAEMLMETSEQWALKRRLSSVFLRVGAEKASKPACNLYQKRGYQMISSGFDIQSGIIPPQKATCFGMEKTLG